MRDIYAWLVTVVMMTAVLLPSVAFATPEKEESLLHTIEQIIAWKKQDEHIAESDPLLSKPFLAHAGNTNGDWYPVGLGRIGYPDDYQAYLAVIKNNVIERYKTKDQLSDMKATEWHRISLAILAAGGDPTAVGDSNLIADGTYNRGLKTSLGAQGINGWIWGLITLDSMRYKVPDDADMTRIEIIKEIISLQLEDGGFSFYQDEAETDMTAMAIQALAPYYQSTEEFTYTQKDTGENVTKTIHTIVDEALEKLSDMQTSTGGFSTLDDDNVESAAQVLVALTSLGIHPDEDERFKKGDHSLLDFIMDFQMEDGGFVHAKTYNADNPSSLPDESNSMASEQVLYALVSLYRLENGYRTMYDFRPENPQEMKQQMLKLMEDIQNINEHTDAKQLQQLLDTYENFPIEERSFVYNFHKLAEAAKKQSIQLDLPAFSEAYEVYTKGNGTIAPIYQEQTAPRNITEQDVEKIDAIPTPLTTEHYIDVVSMIDQFEQADNKGDFEKELVKLYEYKEEMEKMEAEIQSINDMVLDQLYPFNELTSKDQDNVDAILERFNALSPYDQGKVLNYEDLKKSKTQIDNAVRAKRISWVLGIVAVGLILVVISRIQKRRRQRD
ncbi:hypothetical protein CSV72_03990 [Sporosarcina sp. P20a]|uniref:prenyltransferase/squalene oxidase repeat-containing protein n=1 Tax=Sporosarcina sp. P20a TaxID=2048256 RepID=UPI000C163470|nr:prenyltransferase/squalene oxidase repeat-containing protein [Sporosarcina sp. P20a]PIC87146.1 hypothetical protein CSV72_03990 [Sporosarcina sp. P20a]